MLFGFYDHFRLFKFFAKLGEILTIPIPRFRIFFSASAKTLFFYVSSQLQIFVELVKFITIKWQY